MLFLHPLSLCPESSLGSGVQIYLALWLSAVSCQQLFLCSPGVAPRHVGLCCISSVRRLRRAQKQKRPSWSRGALSYKDYYTTFLNLVKENLHYLVSADNGIGYVKSGRVVMLHNQIL